MSTTERPKAIAHPRVSSKKQAQEGESLEVQERLAIAFADQRGWDVVKVFKESYSGWKAGRETFVEILAYLDAHPGEISFYIFKSIDRFTRGGTVSYDAMKRDLTKRGVQMVDTTGMIQPTKNTIEDTGFEYPWSRISPSEVTEAVMATTSKGEINVIQTRMIGQEIRLTQRGFKVRRAQDGFRNIKRHDEGKKHTVMEADPERAKYYRAMFELRAAGQLTDEEIVSRINATGFRTRFFNRWDKDHTKPIGTVGGAPLTVKMLQEIVQRPIYAGFICEKWTRYQPVKAQFPGLVSLDTFNKANRGKVFIQDNGDGSYGILHDHFPEKKVVKRMRDNPLFPYKSVVACPECGMPFLGSSSKSKSNRPVPYYHCSRGHKYLGIGKAVFDKTIEDYINDLNLNPESLVSFGAVLRDKFHMRQAEILQETAAAGQSIAELELQKKQAIDSFMVATSPMMQQALEQQAEKLDAQIKAGRTERTKMEVEESDIDAFLKDTEIVMEHPAELLLNPVNTTQLVSLYSLVFEETPTYTEFANGTPKLSWVFRLSEDSGDPESGLAGPVGIEPTLVDLEATVLPLYDGPVRGILTQNRPFGRFWLSMFKNLSDARREREATRAVRAGTVRAHRNEQRSR